MPTDSVVKISSNIVVDNHTAALINQMAKKFYSDPDNINMYQDWHLKKYGFLPKGEGNASR